MLSRSPERRATVSGRISSGSFDCNTSSAGSPREELAFDGAATRAKLPGSQRGINCLGMQVACADLPWSVGHYLLGGQNSVLDQAADHMIGDAKRTHP